MDHFYNKRTQTTKTDQIEQEKPRDSSQAS